VEVQETSAPEPVVMCRSTRVGETRHGAARLDFSGVYIRNHGTLDQMNREDDPRVASSQEQDAPLQRRFVDVRAVPVTAMARK